jgi:hypothetical protein
MERLIGSHAISYESVQTLVMPSNAGTAALRNFVPLESELQILAAAFILFGSESFLPFRADVSYKPKGGWRPSRISTIFSLREKSAYSKPPGAGSWPRNHSSIYNGCRLMQNPKW